MRECPHNAGDPVFPTYRHGPLGRHALEKLLDKYVAVASVACPSFTGKNVTPHTLRHTCAMRLLESGVDITVIALWLGHFSGVTSLSRSVHPRTGVRILCYTLCERRRGNSCRRCGSR
jgi:site-specific recombinase XerD